MAAPGPIDVRNRFDRLIFIYTEGVSDDCYCSCIVQRESGLSVVQDVRCSPGSRTAIVLFHERWVNGKPPTWLVRTEIRHEL